MVKVVTPLPFAVFFLVKQLLAGGSKAKKDAFHAVGHRTGVTSRFDVCVVLWV
jgi:hypothetical protein